NFFRFPIRVIRVIRGWIFPPRLSVGQSPSDARREYTHAPTIPIAPAIMCDIATWTQWKVTTASPALYVQIVLSLTRGHRASKRLRRSRHRECVGFVEGFSHHGSVSTMFAHRVDRRVRCCGRFVSSVRVAAV